MRKLKRKRKLLSGSQQMLFHLKWKEKSFDTRKVAIGNLTDNRILSWSHTKTCLTYKQECCFSHQKNTSEVCPVLYTWPNKEHDCVINVLFKFWGLVHYVTGVQHFITHASHSQRLITFIPQVQMYSRVNTRKYDVSSGPFVKILHFLLPPHSGSVSLKRKLSWLVSGSWSKLFVVPLKNKLGNKRTCLYITKLVITWHFHCHGSQVRMGSVSASKEHIRLCLRLVACLLSESMP